MIINNCDHEWKKTPTGKYACSKYNEWPTSADVFQLESTINQTKLAQHQLGFQKWLSILAFIVSIIAIIIAGLK